MPKKKLCNHCPLMDNEFGDCMLNYTIIDYEYSLDCKLIQIKCEDKTILPEIED